MIMEAMRLSLLDHEEHQRKSATETQNKNQPGAPPQGQPQAASEQTRRMSTNQPPAGGQTPSSPMGATPSSSRRSSNAAGTMASWRASNEHNNGHGGGRAQAAASKLLSKITVNRSRANSKSSVHFAASPTTLGSSSSGPGPSSSARARSASASTPSTISSEHHPSPLGSTSLGPASRRSLDVNAVRAPAQPLVSDRDSITEFSAGPSAPTPERSNSDLIDMGSVDSHTPPDVDEPSTPRMAPQASAPQTPTANVSQGASQDVGQEPLDISPSRNSVAESFDSRSSFAASYTDPVPRAARSKPLAAMADDD